MTRSKYLIFGLALVLLGVVLINDEGHWDGRLVVGDEDEHECWQILRPGPQTQHLDDINVHL